MRDFDPYIERMNKLTFYPGIDVCNDAQIKELRHETKVMSFHSKEEMETMREMTAGGWTSFFRSEKSTGRVLRFFSRLKTA